MPRTLPGGDKYRRPDDRPVPWQDPLVLRANTEVRIEDVLNTYFGMHVPMEADRWKTRCPFAREHDDGGLDRQFRVYSATNSGHCFALHGTLDPVRLWRMRAYFATVRDAAEDLLTTFGIDYRPKPYAERMAALRERPGFTAYPDDVVAAFTVFLSTVPAYESRQYEESVLRTVNSLLSEVHNVCATATCVEDVEQWLQQSKTRMASLLGLTP